MSEIAKKVVAVIVPDQQSLELYHRYLQQHQSGSYEIRTYCSLAEFNRDMYWFPGYLGFIVEVSMLLKASPNDKAFLQHLADAFPFIRTSVTADKQGIKGTWQGKALEDVELFATFFHEMCAPQRGNGKADVVFIVDDPGSLALYESRLNCYPGLSYTHYRSAADLWENVTTETRYRGFFIDLRTILNAKPKEKDMLYELIESFPTVRISHSLDKKTIKGNIKSRNLTDKELFDHFINEICSGFPARGIRLQKRKDLYLNAYLDFNTNERPARVNTLNVSEEGLFVISTRPVEMGEPVKLVINELTDQQPINCNVMWTLPWGLSSNHLPGFGVRFDSISPRQREELHAMLKKSKD